MADPSHQHNQQQQQLQQRGQQAVDSFKTFLYEKSPSTPQFLALLTVLPLGAFLLFVAGIALFGSVVGLAVTAPLFLLFSPVLVPAVLTIGLAVAGFLASGAFGLTGLSAISWIVNYLRGARPMRSIERVTRSAHETAGYLGQKGWEMGQDVAGKAQDAAGYVGQKTKEMGQDVSSRAQDTTGRAREAGKA